MMTKVGSDSLEYYSVFMWLQQLVIILCRESYFRTKENPTHQGYIVSLSSANHTILPGDQAIFSCLSPPPLHSMLPSSLLLRPTLTLVF